MTTMGLVRHHAIICTSWSADDIEQARAAAVKIFPRGHVSQPIKTLGHYTFFVAPDGSKEGWDESNEGDEHRDAFVRWLAERTHYGSDEWCPVHWVEVEYGEDTGWPRDTDRVTRGRQMFDDDEEGEPTGDAIKDDWQQWPLRGCWRTGKKP